jgi:hypothetical protein
LVQLAASGRLFSCIFSLLLLPMTNREFLDDLAARIQADLFRPEERRDLLQLSSRERWLAIELYKRWRRLPPVRRRAPPQAGPLSL